MNKFVFFIVLFLSVSAEAKLLDLTYFKLDNGLEVAVVENHKAPVILQMLYYKTGSINDPVGKGGVAHLLEHLMFRGTKKVPDQEFNRLTDLYGATNNAYTTYDETGYYEFSDVSKLELMMALEADRMQNLQISEEAFLKERDVVLQERYQRFETKPTSLFYEMLQKMLWQEHPFARPVSGSVAEIKGLEKKDALDFYENWYRPDNVLVVLAGDITEDEARKLTEKYYGNITVKKALSPVSEIAAPRAMDTLISSRVENVEQPRFVTFVRLEKGSLSKKDELALSVLAEYLAGDDTSYLYDELVYKNKKLLSIDIGISYDNKMGGTVSFYAVPANDTLKIEEIKEMLDAKIAEGLAQLSEEKIVKIKNQILSDTVYLLENPESTARFVGAMLLSGYCVDKIEQYDEDLQAVSLDDVLQAWKIVGQSNVRLTGYLGAKGK